MHRGKLYCTSQDFVTTRVKSRSVGRCCRELPYPSLTLPARAQLRTETPRLKLPVLLELSGSLTPEVITKPLLICETDAAAQI